MDLDPAVAVYLASSLLRRKPDSPSSSSAGTNKPKVGYGDDVAPSRPPGEPLLSPGPGPGPAEKKRDVLELKVKAAPEPGPESVTVPEPITKKAPTQEPFSEPNKIQESSPEPLEAYVPATEPAIEPEPAVEPEPAKQNVGEPSPEPEPEPAPEVVQQPEVDKVDESGPEPAETVSGPTRLVVEELEPEHNSLNDVAAAAAQNESSKLEALMEEQRIELTSDLTCL